MSKDCRTIRRFGVSLRYILTRILRGTWNIGEVKFFTHYWEQPLHFINSRQCNCGNFGPLFFFAGLYFSLIVEVLWKEIRIINSQKIIAWIKQNTWINMYKTLINPFIYVYEDKITLECQSSPGLRMQYDKTGYIFESFELKYAK